MKLIIMLYLIIIFSVSPYQPLMDSLCGLFVIKSSFPLSGCFTADNQHAESIGLVTEVHRGCSTFITETITCAHMDYLDSEKTE